jgi:hypothetical protein
MSEYLRKSVDVVQHKLSQQTAFFKAQIADHVRDKERLLLENA